MSVVRACTTDVHRVKQLTEETIRAVYPRYYPSGAVQFFLDHHGEESIAADVENGLVYLCLDDDRKVVGTVTIRDHEICRLFVLPAEQGKGYGRELLQYAERIAAAQADCILLDASLPAKAIYLKKGYVSTAFHTIETSNGDYLCYDVMCKHIAADTDN